MKRVALVAAALLAAPACTPPGPTISVDIEPSDYDLGRQTAQEVIDSVPGQYPCADFEQAYGSRQGAIDFFVADAERRGERITNPFASGLTDYIIDFCDLPW